MTTLKLPEGFKLEAIEDSFYITHNGGIASILDIDLKFDKEAIMKKLSENQIAALNNGEEIEI